MLTAAKVKSIRKAGRYGDGRNGLGLSLLVQPSGSKSWAQRLTIAGTRRDLGLGGFPLVPLAEARKKARANVEAVAEGRDPRAPKREAAPPTFGQAVEAVHKAHRPRWSADHARGWLLSLRKHAGALWAVRVNQIERHDVLDLLERCRATSPNTARRIRQRVRQVLGWAQAYGYVDQNFAGEAISAALPPVPQGDHHRAVDYRDVPDALRRIGEGGATRLALRMVILTAARQGEVRGMMWEEIDPLQRLWTVPARRMKARREHRVPLSAAAMDVLAAARGLGDGSGVVFPSPATGRALSDQAFADALKVEGIDGTPHGFRSSFRTWAAETGQRWDAAEMCLAHNVGSNVERAYSRTDLLEQRRALMDAWVAYCVG